MFKILLFSLTILAIIDGRRMRIIRNRNCECGMPSNISIDQVNQTNPKNPKHRIINGQATEANEFPWIVGLYDNQRCRGIPVCGGTVISSHHILTAAHCVEGKKNLAQLLNSQFEIQEEPFNAQVWATMIYRGEVALLIRYWIDSKIFLQSFLFW